MQYAFGVFFEIFYTDAVYSAILLYRYLPRENILRRLFLQGAAYQYIGQGAVGRVFNDKCVLYAVGMRIVCASEKDIGIVAAKQLRKIKSYDILNKLIFGSIV